MTAQPPNTSVTTNPSFYEKDYYLWLQTTAKQLREGKWSEVDRANLIEEIESMGRSEKNALVSNLQIVLMHLLKHKYQPEKRSNSWLLTIFEHRDRLLEAFEISPSLKLYFREVSAKCYAKARKKGFSGNGIAD